MKIGILTQPLHNNYGGLLQAYALQTTLKKMGHEPWIVRRVIGKRPFIRKIASSLKYLVLKYILNKRNLHSPFKKQIMISEDEKRIVSTFTSVFVEKYIHPKTDLIDNNRDLKKLIKQGFDAFIVGSDQVWRLIYSPYMPNYFLDFLGNNKKIKRLAYAASFGLDKWHFPYFLTKKTKRLAKRFNAISVREESAVKLCQEYLNVKAQHLVDPTLLLKKEEYLKIVKNENEPKSPGNLFIYILDKSEEKEKWISMISKELGMMPFSVMPSNKLSAENKEEINNCIFPPVTKWLKGFEDAAIVVTDSFHGCIFSILFNIPFIAFANSKRGSTRFISLLKMFDLSDRLISDGDLFNLDRLLKPVNWDEVNLKLENERKKSFYFLNYNLSSN